MSNHIREKKYPLSLHIFRRDLRLDDNTAFIEAHRQSDQVMPCFIFDSRQIENNHYASVNSLQFMKKSLLELEHALQKQQGKLYFFYGIAEDIVKLLLSSLPIKAIYINRDYTPFSQHRDAKIEKIARSHEIDYHCYADALLHEPEEVVKKNGSPYIIYTPAYHHASSLQVASPVKLKQGHYFNQSLSFENRTPLETLFKYSNSNIKVKGGRKEALELLRGIQHLKDYQTSRDYPALSSTTHLSAHLKFGTVSVRECYAAICEAFNKHHLLIKELYWRDFFTHIAFYFPHVFRGAFHEKYNSIAWKHNEDYFNRWCHGQTGFPIVDAGMRELNCTGYMHNRVRMIVASFLVKDLHLDWRSGERYFANQLVDYDPSVNNGNWQWAASTGCDAQPYFRIFNPWLQQKKFDPECVYIKEWVPELSDFSPKMIHALDKVASENRKNYPSPMVNHAIASQQAKILYKIK